MLYKSIHNAKIKDGKKRIIEGWLSTEDLDEWGDITHFDAFDKHLGIFMKNPQMYFGHEAWKKPIGKWLNISPVEGKGVWAVGQVAHSTLDAEEAWTLLEQGMLKALSFGFDIISHHFDDDGNRHLTDLKLLEGSVVGLGMNRLALLESAQEKGITIKSLIAPDQPGAEKKENTMNLEELTKQVGTLETNLKTNVMTIDQAKQTIADLQTTIEELKAKPGGVTDADLKALQEKSQADLMAAVGKLNETIKSKVVSVPGMDHDVGSIEQAKRLGLTKDLGNPDAFKSRLIYQNFEKAATGVGMLSQKHIIEEMQSKSDDLLIIGRILGMCKSDGVGSMHWEGSPQGLKTFQEYNALMGEVHKALDTGTAGTGGSWLPTGFSAILQEGLELKRGVIAKMRRFPMPQTPYTWPLQTSRSIPYLFSEATSDNNANTIAASTPGTSSITFTAQGIAVAVWNSREAEEDLIIPILAFIKNDIQLAMKNGEENAVINGDNATTHQDTDTAAGAANLVAKAFDGLRLDAIANAGADASGTLTYALLVALLEDAGKYGIAPNVGFFAASIAAYYKALALTQVTGFDAFGASAVVAKGALPRILGHEMVPTENMRQDLGPVGVNAASDNVHTAILYVNPDGFLIGDRRNYTLDEQFYPLTQQRVTVATIRLDMQKMVPSGDTPCSILYNITT